MANPLISVLLPTRGRPTSVRSTMEGLYELAEVPDQVEILIATDPDDKSAVDAGLPAGRNQVWVAPERYGYNRLHHYVNHLAMMATGNWLFLWNDDAIMLTRHWDKVIAQHEETVIWPEHNDDTARECNLFPIWPRRWTQHVGHVSLNAHCDMWVQSVGNRLGHTGVQNELKIIHDRYDLTGGHDDVTYRERQRDMQAYWGLRDARQADAEKIKEII
jgi:hypothetical protein